MTAPAVAINAKRLVRLSDLCLDHKHWKNPREFSGLDDPQIAELGADIKVRGIQDPPKVQQIRAAHGQITQLVIDGQRRVLAALEVLPKDTMIPVIDRTNEAIELTPEAADEIMLDMLAVVTYREGLSSYELSAVAERLRSRGRKLSEIAKAIKRDESWVSKMLSARSTATPPLMIKWKKGQVTDEQFKDLATVKEPEKQAEAVREVVKARESGDMAEARIRAKELAAGFKQDAKKSSTPANGHAAKPVVAGPQADMFDDKKPDPPKRTPMTSRIALEELVAMSDKRPPTHDYVKGIMAGVNYAIGEIGPEEFAKPWKAYLARIDGSGSGKKKRKAKSRKAVKKAAAKKKRR